jgi:histidyl-tRNA synthetase
VAGRFQTLRGFKDLLPGETEHWQEFESRARELFRRCGFREIRTPHLESTELFVRSVGGETDIVGKEMFTFGEGEDSVSLRPEMTASVCRAYVEHGLDRRGISRLFYIGPAFRRERPQKGRLRQFHQVGAEVFGESSPATDVEIVALAVDLVRASGAKSPELLINSIGDAKCRPAHRAALTEVLRALAPELCEDCRRRIDRSPLRVLDCKNPGCQAALKDAPRMVDYLCDECRAHFDRVLEGLSSLGFAQRLAPQLVRGLDYYVRTTFEVRAAGLGAQDAVLGGGRYDGLVADLGGGPVPGIGWAAGVERLLLAAGNGEPAPADLDAFVVTLGDAARSGAALFVRRLRESGLAVGWDPEGHGLGGQMKRAGRSGARCAVLVGDDELARGAVTVKDLVTGEQGEGPADPAQLVAHLQALRKKAGPGGGGAHER